MEPHTKPIYDNRVAPYVDSVSAYLSPMAPYASRASHVASSLAIKTKRSYDRVAAPQVAKVSQKIDTIVAPYQEKWVQFHTSHVDPYVASARMRLHSVCSHISNVYAKVHPIAAPHVNRAYEFAKPKVLYAVDRAYFYTLKFAKASCNWVNSTVVPQVSTLYHGTVEPQIKRVYERLFDGPTSASSAAHVDANPTIVASDPTPTEVLEEPEPIVKSKHVHSVAQTLPVESQVVEQDEQEQEEQVMGTGLPEIDTLDATTPQPTVIEITVTETQLSSQPTSSELSSSEQLLQWEQIVQTTTREAIAAFIDDIELEKSTMMERERPTFTDLLRALQDVQRKTISHLSLLITNMENGDESITIAVVQDEFRQCAEDIRTSAMAVRQHAQKFAADIVERIEEVRMATLDVLDEFAEVTLQAIGRQMVSAETGSRSSTGSGPSPSPNWKDWRAFRSLKERLIKSREDIADYEANTADVNQMLREAQETANVLAKETAQYMSGLRSKADHIFVQRANQATEPSSEPEDAVFYDASDEEDDIARYSQTQHASETLDASEPTQSLSQDDSQVQHDKNEQQVLKGDTEAVEDEPEDIEPETEPEETEPEETEETELEETEETEPEETEEAEPEEELDETDEIELDEDDISIDEETEDFD